MKIFLLLKETEFSTVIKSDFADVAQANDGICDEGRVLSSGVVNYTGEVSTSVQAGIGRLAWCAWFL